MAGYLSIGAAQHGGGTLTHSAMYLCRVDTCVPAKRLIDLCLPYCRSCLGLRGEDDLRPPRGLAPLDYALRKGGMRSLRPRNHCGTGGKPFFAGESELYFSLSHWGMGGCAWTVRPIGVDIERIRPYTRLDDVARRCVRRGPGLCPGGAQPDRLFTALGCLKESYAKAMGRDCRCPCAPLPSMWTLAGASWRMPQTEFALRSDLRGFMVAVCADSA